MGYRRMYIPRSPSSNSDGGVGSALGGLWNGIIALGILVGGGLAIYWAIGHFKEKPEENAKSPGARSQAERPRVGAGSRGGRTGASAFPAPPPLRPQIERAMLDLNMAVLAKESARYKGDRAGEGRNLSAATEAAARLGSLARAEPNLPEHLDPTDEILKVDDIDLVRLRPDEASAHLDRVALRVPQGTYVKFAVYHFGQWRELYVWFSNAVGLPAFRPDASGRVQITNALALEIQKEVLTLPPAQLPDAERKQIEEILGRGYATSEEYALLTRRVASETANAADVAQEKESFRAQVAKIERMLPKAPVADVVLAKDGRHVTGQIVQDNSFSVVVETPYGKVTVPKPEVVHIYSADELREQFTNKLATAKEKVEAFPQLLVWTRDWGMPLHREYVAYVMLTTEPENRAARLAAGFYQAANGRWAMGQSLAQGTKPAFKKPETKRELQPELESLGFVLKVDHWYSKVAWEAGVDNLHRTGGEFHWTLQGMQLFTWYEQDTPQSRLFNPTGKPKDPSVQPRLRFYAPITTAGMASLMVDAPGEILSCSVKAAGHVVERGHSGKVEVFLIAEGGKQDRLYSIEESGDENFHDVTALVAGKRRFTLTVRATTTQDKYHTYARFLPSLPETKEVFWIRGLVLQAAPEIDRSWAATQN
jgi:hypothetical protein